MRNISLWDLIIGKKRIIYLKITFLLVYVLGLKRWINLNNDKAFGDEIAKKFNIGDLVSWIELKEDEKNRLNRVLKCGVLTNIIRKQLGERDVVFACVLPLNSAQIVELSIAKIRKI